MKRIFAIIGVVLAVAASVAVAGFVLYCAGKSRAEQTCRAEQIGIERNGATVYLQDRDIEKWLQTHGIGLKGERLQSLNAAYVETVLLQNPYVETAQVYATEDGVMHLDIWQRNPVLKVLTKRQTLFQIDAGGVEMPVNPDYRVRLRVVSGHLPFQPVYGENVNDLSDTSARAVLKLLFRLNARLSADPLWDAMFEQIYVTEKGEIELIPKVGPQTVMLGKIADMTDFADKMDRLEIFYKNGMTEENWRIYKTLNLKYKNQLVATRK